MPPRHSPIGTPNHWLSPYTPPHRLSALGREAAHSRARSHVSALSTAGWTCSRASARAARADSRTPRSAGVAPRAARRSSSLRRDASQAWSTAIAVRRSASAAAYASASSSVCSFMSRSAMDSPGGCDGPLHGRGGEYSDRCRRSEPGPERRAYVVTPQDGGRPAPPRRVRRPAAPSRSSSGPSDASAYDRRPLRRRAAASHAAADSAPCPAGAPSARSRDPASRCSPPFGPVPRSSPAASTDPPLGVGGGPRRARQDDNMPLYRNLDTQRSTSSGAPEWLPLVAFAARSHRAVCLVVPVQSQAADTAAPPSSKTSSSQGVPHHLSV